MQIILLTIYTFEIESPFSKNVYARAVGKRLTKVTPTPNIDFTVLDSIDLSCSSKSKTSVKANLCYIF